MKLHKVHIQNYRCFESLEVELGQQCTVVIGKNGAGKSTLLSALRTRDFGYFGWDDTVNSMDLWILNSDKRLPEFELEFEFVKNKILQVFKPLKPNYDFINETFQIENVRVYRLRPDAKETLEFLFSDSRAMLFEMLPQGYKRILSIAIDLAYRSFILNKDAETSGVCFIDEIELHLHPSLQQEIIARLCRAFPNIQFIVTTHSPLVISNFNADGVQNKIIQLEQEGNSYSVKELENVYGLDYATNLAEVMGVAPRASTIDKYINAYLFLMGKGKKEKAEVMLGHLSEYLGGEIPPKLLEEIQSKVPIQIVVH